MNVNMLKAIIREATDQNDDNVNDFDDVKIARMKASGMSVSQIKKKYPDLFEGDHPAEYSPKAKSIRGMTRGEALDKTQADLKKAKELRKAGKGKQATELEKKAYRRREAMENKARKDMKESYLMSEETLRGLIRHIFEACNISKSTKKTLKNKAEKGGYTVGSVEKEFCAGRGAWNSSGSKKGMAQDQWAHARVNSAMEGGKSWSVLKKSKRKKKK